MGWCEIKKAKLVVAGDDFSIALEHTRRTQWWNARRGILLPDGSGQCSFRLIARSMNSRAWLVLAQGYDQGEWTNEIPMQSGLWLFPANKCGVSATA